MPDATTTAIAIFFLIWWVVLFAVLPWGVRSQHEGGEIIAGHRSWRARLSQSCGRKLVWTTLVASVIFAACYVVYADHLVTLDSLLAPFGCQPNPMNSIAINANSLSLVV